MCQARQIDERKQAMKKSTIIATIAAAALSISLMGCASNADSKQLVSYTDENGITYVGNEWPENFNSDNMIPLYCECGACGAHITEWYWIYNNKDEKVPVCKFCNDAAIEWDKANGIG